MKNFGFLFLAFIFFVTAFAQESRDIMATADDGRRVILKADNTWQFSDAEIAEWRLLKKWIGSGSKNTESFIVTAKEWRVCWITKQAELGGLLLITAYKEDSEMPLMVANITGGSKDCSYMRGAGEYWLDINALQRWEIVVEEKIAK